MSTTAPSHTLELIEQHCEVHFTIGGFWTLEGMQGFLGEINETVLPLMKARAPIYAMGDFTDFVPQDRATGDAIRDHLLGSVKYGLKRVAIVGASPLTTLQYKRLSDGLQVEFFDSKAAGTAWLRADR
uniref:hypothetical protein n=1 Tax=uncultured Erythrobacter sp. TaxID=263913 RepID=UPI002626DCA6|nr:hypothetical protein [uncultured Erythrobacter sp.]